MKILHYVLLVGAAIIFAAVIIPSMYANAQNVSAIATISVRRVDNGTDNSRQILDPIAARQYPIMVDAMVKADKKYDEFVTWCLSQTYNCFYNSYAMILDPVVVTTIPITEAKATINNLNFSDLEVPNAAPGTHHGIHLQYEGRYYAIAISNVQK